jgi:hypothetical protein
MSIPHLLLPNSLSSNIMDTVATSVHCAAAAACRRSGVQEPRRLVAWMCPVLSCCFWAFCCWPWVASGPHMLMRCLPCACSLSTEALMSMQWHVSLALLRHGSAGHCGKDPCTCTYVRAVACKLITLLSTSSAIICSLLLASYHPTITLQAGLCGIPGLPDRSRSFVHPLLSQASAPRNHVRYSTQIVTCVNIIKHRTYAVGTKMGLAS